MKTLEVFFHIKDYEKVVLIPDLKQCYEYSNADCSNVRPDEWGKLVFNDLVMKFFSLQDDDYDNEKDQIK